MKILCAAIHYDDGEVYPFNPKNIHSGLVVCGLRHCDCIQILSKFSTVVDRAGKSVQGFLTDDNRFMNRIEAFRVAKKANQIINEFTRSCMLAELKSEDLY